MAQWLSERLGQPFVIENRAGAGGGVDRGGGEGAADGYTLLKVVPANTVNDALYDKLPFISFATSRRSPAWCACPVPVVNPWCRSRPSRCRLRANPGKLNFLRPASHRIHMSQ